MTPVLFSDVWQVKDYELRHYQIEGIKWFIDCIKEGHGGILADEMGLGKTIQTLCAILSCQDIFKFSKFLIIVPLSTVNNWKNEFYRFSADIIFTVYIGNRIERSNLRNSLKWDSGTHILLTTYECFLNDFEELCHLKLDLAIVDEAHRLKNSESLLFARFNEMPISYRFLLTGTPLQNNLDELYNLLSIVDSRDSAVLSDRSSFKKKLEKGLPSLNLDADFSGILKDDPALSKLMLRRIKAEVLLDLPEKVEVLIFHGLTKLQKQLYKSLLTKNINIFKSTSSSTNQDFSSNKRLMNILMQIRKAVLHPYLFPGVENEPFQLGEHLVDQSMKLQVLDRLLQFLMPLSHKVLVFSQMTKMLDIIQDYCSLRGFNYERLDGSVRCEERFAAIDKFSTNESTRLFLLSTRAGGQGLNLTAADTVILVDSDFNPQVDLQAMARVHRPGQQRPCRTIRLVAKNSVEEMIVYRAQGKLRMTRGVLGHEDKKECDNKLNIREMVCYGLDQLFSDDSDNSNFTFTNDFFTSILGGTDDKGHWKSVVKDEKLNNKENVSSIDHMYVFDGFDYKPNTSKKDYKVVINMAELQKDNGKTTVDKKKSAGSTQINTASSKKLKSDTNSQSKINKRKEQMWKDNKYKSHKIVMKNEDNESDDGRNSTDSETSIDFVIGDVTNPFGDINTMKIICHLVDDSGSWGTGGLFSAIDQINFDVSLKYIQAEEMEDLKLGDVHVFPFKLNVKVALLVAQSRDKDGHITPIKMNHLETCFKAVGNFALQNNATIHLTRLGYKTPQFNWYGIERLIQKQFIERNIQTFIYYYRRGVTGNTTAFSDTKLSGQYFKCVLKGVVIYFDPSVDPTTIQMLTKHIYALDGDVTTNPFDDRITHCIVQNGLKNAQRICRSEAHYLCLDWLLQCIRQSSLIPESDFSCET